MQEEISIRRVGNSLYLRVPRWLVDIRALRPGDTGIWKLDDLAPDTEIKLQLVKATEEAAA
jgi:hypothetical protein